MRGFVSTALERKVRAPQLKKWKSEGRRIAMLTAYDALTARLLEKAGVDVLLVGDSLGMVVLGYETTVPVTVDDVVHHAAAVSRVAKRPLVVADLPFLSYQKSLEQAVHNAARLLQEGGAEAVKLEGGEAVAGVVARLTEIGIPVMGHLGLMPQAVHQLGGFRRQARTEPEAERLIADALALEKAGAFAIVLESIPHELARRVTAELAIPTIGIGAGPHCDGQVLVTQDMLGLYDEVPPFAKLYANLAKETVRAIEAYVTEVRSGEFPEERS
ncbi:MAG: 3-methyl-2-oxobutanoate hydroxymethyltransferase [Bryobacterales bacterium]|nr:3-methyl-2-oxobutanoate hydroxymethyltransferase [Acidobacteriota bacterium]MCB9383931.1 3-methyl-2-oxobutanoate hydroxymethyltransferase [Bryobacterales bacterium]